MSDETIIKVPIAYANPITDLFKISVTPDADGGHRRYRIEAEANNGSFDQGFAFQHGDPREIGINGIISPVVLAVMQDHLHSFLKDGGDYYTEQMVQCLWAAQYWMNRRAEDRQRRGVFGSPAK